MEARNELAEKIWDLTKDLTPLDFFNEVKLKGLEEKLDSLKACVTSELWMAALFKHAAMSVEALKAGEGEKLVLVKPDEAMLEVSTLVAEHKQSLLTTESGALDVTGLGFETGKRKAQWKSERNKFGVR